MTGYCVLTYYLASKQCGHKLKANIKSILIVDRNQTLSVDRANGFDDKFATDAAGSVVAFDDDARFTCRRVQGDADRKAGVAVNDVVVDTRLLRHP